VAPSFVPEDKRDDLRKSLLWQGFNTLVNGLYAHPSGDRASLDETLSEQELQGCVVVMAAQTEDQHSQEAIKQLVKNRWSLDELESFYSDFFAYYQKASQRLLPTPASAAAITPADCCLMRLLLVHEYRRILLRDPDFPSAMLPPNWVGHKALALMTQLYQALASPASEFIQSELENELGTLPPAQAEYYQRFEGLQP